MLKYSISVSTCDSEMLNLDVIWSCRFSSSNSSIRFLSFSDSSWEFLSSALYLYNSFCIVMISEHRLERRWKKRNENKWLKPLWNHIWIYIYEDWNISDFLTASTRSRSYVFCLRPPSWSAFDEVWTIDNRWRWGGEIWDKRATWWYNFVLISHLELGAILLDSFTSKICWMLLWWLSIKVLFTDCCRWQNFCPSLLHLVNNCVVCRVYLQDTKA